MDASIPAGAPSPENVTRFLTGRGGGRAVDAVGKTQGSGAAAGTGQSSGDLNAAVDEIKAFAGARLRALDFSIDEPTGQTVITVREQASGDVIRQIPAEEVLAVAARIREMQGGSGSLLMQEKG